MASHKIEISVTGNQKGGDFKETARQAASTRQYVERTVAPPGKADSGKFQSGVGGVVKSIAGIFGRGDSSKDPGIQQQAQVTRANTSAAVALGRNIKDLGSIFMRYATKMAAGGGGGGGKNMGSENTSVPILDFVLNKLQFLYQNMNAVGEQAMAIIGQQKSTMGLAGTTYSGGFNYFMAAELAAAKKESILASGQFARKGSMAGDTLKVAGDYARTFGLGPEVARFQGLLDRLDPTASGAAGTRGGDMGVMGQIMARLGQAGVETDLPIVIQAMQGTMEEAVRRGVNSSSLPNDLANEISAYTKLSGGNAQFAAEISRVIGDKFSSVVAGDFEQDPMTLKMTEAALEIARTAEGRQELSQKVFGGQALSESDLYNPATAQIGAKYFAQTRRADVESAAMASMAKQLGITPGADANKQAQAINYAAATMFQGPEGFNQAQAFVKGLMNPGQFKAGAPVVGDSVLTNKLRKPAGGLAQAVVSKDVGFEASTIEVGGKLIESIIAMREAFLELAKAANAAKLADAFNLYNQTLAKGAEELAKGLEFMSKELPELVQKSEAALKKLNSLMSW